MSKKVNKIKVRMYRQGLGDCFLIQFLSNSDTVFSMMIDCGVLTGTKDADTIMRNVVNDIAGITGKKLDVVVATHEHWDHVSGFVQAKAEFDKISIGKIWLSWAENPNDKLAKILKKDMALKLNALQQFRANVQLDEFSMVDNALSFFAAGEGRKTSDALDYLKKRKEAEVNYYDPGEVIKLEDLPDFRFYVLGPPKDEKAIKQNMSSKDNIIYKLGMGNDFLAAFTDQKNDLDKNIFGEKYLLGNDKEEISKKYNSESASWRKIDDAYLNNADNIALNLDSNTNNTSLVIAIECVKTGKVLLFPGDAQVGSWTSWDSYTFNIENNKNKKVEVHSEDLLSNTVLYKVGHHGSHNATIKNRGLELMTNDELAAMIPVDRAMAKKKKWKMPADKLYKRLVDLTGGRIIILDDDKIEGKESGKRKKSTKKTDFDKNITSTKLFHELTIEL